MIIMSLSNIDATLTKDDFKHVSYRLLGVDVEQLEVTRVFTSLESIQGAQTMMYITLIEVLLISILFLIPLSYLVYI